MRFANLLKVSNCAIIVNVPKDEVYIEITDKQRYLFIGSKIVKFVRINSNEAKTKKERVLS
ncbi:hypothetical protein GCM10019998_13080 [Tetragenococcus solitarius]|uniref:Uncharacterized protein n=1 Tax=Tetragenococcus solitarius TaxID=71453 RepID=A0ABP6KMV5_9ENTE